MAERERVLSLIKTTYPFHKFDDNQINFVIESLEEAKYAKGQCIYKEGYPSDSDHLCIIFEGKVRLERKEKGTAREVVVMGVGEVFGHEMLESNKKHPVSSYAETDVIVLKLNRTKINAMVAKNQQLVIPLRLMYDSYKTILEHHFSWKGRDEAIYFVSHRHQFWLLQRAILPFFVLVVSMSVLVMIIFSQPEARFGFLLLLLIDLGFCFTWLYLVQQNWEDDIIAITSQRILFQERVLIFYETRVEAPLNAVLSVVTETSQLGRILKFGNVVARTYAGSVYLPMVTNPEQVAAFLELQWKKTKTYDTRAEAASMENIIRNRIGYSKSAPGGAGAPGKPAPGVGPEIKMGGLEAWISNLLQLKTETAAGCIYKTHWIVLLQRTILPISIFLGVLLLLLIVIFNMFTFFTDRLAPFILITILIMILSGIGFWIWYRYEDWANDLYIVGTDQIVDRVKKPFGKEDRKVAPLKNIQSVEFERGGVWGIILNYGTVRITVGETKMIFPTVFNPSDIQREIFKRMADREFKEKTSARENEQKWVIDWIAAYHRVTEQEKKNSSGSSK